MDGKRSQQFGIGEVDRFSILRREFERFEQGPVPDVVAVFRMVVDAVEPMLENQARCALSERPGSRPLKDGGVEFSYAQFQTIARQFLAEKTDPLAGIEVGVTPTVFRRSEDSWLGPGNRHVAKRNVVVLPFDHGKLGVQR